MNSVELALEKIYNPNFNLKYVISKFGDILINDANLFLTNSMTKFDFEMKIKNLIKSDYNTPEGYFNNFILNYNYKFDKESKIYSSLSMSLDVCLLQTFNYRFPKFLNLLHNEFEFNYVIYEMIKKHAPESIKIHKRLKKKNPTYTFHSLHEDKMKVIVGELYSMYLIVQNFLDNLSEEEKNYINTVENLYLIAINDFEKYDKDFIPIILYKNANKNYINKYNTEPPKINFNTLFK